MTTTLLIPGLNGSSHAHWQRYWAQDHVDAFVVEQDNWSCPILSDWQRRLDEALSENDGAIVVAHSLGCLLVGSYAVRKQAGHIRGALLVAPCSLDAARQRHPCLSAFEDTPLSRLPFPSIVVGSSNDPYMSIEDLERHADVWGSELMTIDHAGHINVASGFGRWSQGYNLVNRLVDRNEDATSAPIKTVLRSHPTPSTQNQTNRTNYLANWIEHCRR